MIFIVNNYDAIILLYLVLQKNAAEDVLYNIMDWWYKKDHWTKHDRLHEWQQTELNGELLWGPQQHQQVPSDKEREEEILTNTIHAMFNAPMHITFPQILSHQ